MSTSEKYNETLSAYNKQLLTYDQQHDRYEPIITVINYGVGQAKGHLIQDRLCLDAETESCVDDYSLLSVYETKDLSNLKASGIIGLAPGNFHDSSPMFLQ